MTKNQVRLKAFNFLGNIDSKIRTKFSNINGKTGQYNVPDELFQKRTPRKNRVLISWKTVEKNNLSIEQLESFSGGVAVEFVNEDFFNQENQTNPVFMELKNRIGSNNTIASIITIRSESGSSSSAIQRESFNKFLNNTEIIYNNEKIILSNNNYQNYFITQTESGGIGNEKWNGFLFISIKGGQQDIIESHIENQTIFNPACEFATETVCLDIDLVMIYFALMSVDTSSLSANKTKEYNIILSNIEPHLQNSIYNNVSFSGNLLDYCKNHPSLKMFRGKLYDPIQVKEINIEDFAIDDIKNPKKIDFTHDKAVFYENYYWDTSQNCILSPANPTNIFWSKHLSNMMQQDFSLDGYFRHEEEIVERRRQLLNR